MGMIRTSGVGVALLLLAACGTPAPTATTPVTTATFTTSTPPATTDTTATFTTSTPPATTTTDGSQKALLAVDAKYGQCIDKAGYARNLGEAEVFGDVAAVRYGKLGNPDIRLVFNATARGTGVEPANPATVKAMTAAGC